MKKLKILFLVPSFPSVSETFIVNQIVDLIDKGHEITIFSVGKNNDLIHSKIKEFQLIEKVIYQDTLVNPFSRLYNFIKILLFVKNKYRFNLLKSLNFIKYGKVALTLSSFFKISWISQTNDDFDIVHAHFGFMSDYFFKGKDCGFFQSAKLIVTFHGYDIDPKDSINNKIRYKNLIESKALVTVNTPYLEKIVKQTLGEVIEVHILPVGLDTSYYKNNSKIKLKDVVSVVFCGRFIKLKGVEFLPIIANEIINNRKQKNVLFNIIGGGYEENRKQLVAGIRSFGLENNFKLYGFLSQQDSIEVMSASDIFILPGTYDNGRAETQGLVIQEAQSMCLPVVVTDAGGMRYGVLNDISGYVVKDQDMNSFCDKIEELVNDEALRNKMGKSGRDFVVKNYDSKVLGDKLELLYYSQLNK